MLPYDLACELKCEENSQVFLILGYRNVNHFISRNSVAENSEGHTVVLENNPISESI